MSEVILPAGRFCIRGPSGAIEVLIDEPLGTRPAWGTAVLGHPHPLFGGSMDNKVVQTLAKAYVLEGWRAVRFNFRGIGKSEGTFDNGQGELQDFLTVVSQCAASGLLALGGFSFGAFVASRAIASFDDQRVIVSAVLVGVASSRFDVAPVPSRLRERCLVIHGEQDDTVPLHDVMQWARPQSLPVMVVPGVEHFFHGQLVLLRSLVQRHIRAFVQ